MDPANTSRTTPTRTYERKRGLRQGFETRRSVLTLAVAPRDEGVVTGFQLGFSLSVDLVIHTRSTDREEPSWNPVQSRAAEVERCDLIARTFRFLCLGPHSRVLQQHIELIVLPDQYSDPPSGNSRQPLGSLW
jgi:hypothetical protein